MERKLKIYRQRFIDVPNDGILINVWVVEFPVLMFMTFPTWTDAVDYCRTYWEMRRKLEVAITSST